MISGDLSVSGGCTSRRWAVRRQGLTPGPDPQVGPQSLSRAPFCLPQRRPQRLRQSAAGGARRGLLFLSGERSGSREAGQGAPAPPYSLPPAGPRRAATMSTAAFHISSLLEKMTSSDKDFRCAPPPSPPPLKPTAFLPSRGAGPPQDPAAPAPFPGVKPRPLPGTTTPAPSRTSSALLLPALQPCLSLPLPASSPAVQTSVPASRSPIKAPAPPLCTFLCLFSLRLRPAFDAPTVKRRTPALPVFFLH